MAGTCPYVQDVVLMTSKDEEPQRFWPHTMYRLQGWKLNYRAGLPLTYGYACIVASHTDLLSLLLSAFGPTVD